MDESIFCEDFILVILLLLIKKIIIIKFLV